MDAIKPKKSLVDETYEALVYSICAGEFLPGERLNQDEIAIRLNVSRQPVNSAVAILRANGFVEDTGRRGVVVAAIQPENANVKPKKYCKKARVQLKKAILKRCCRKI